MPAKSKKQQRLMGLALAIKRGKVAKGYSKTASKIAKGMSEEDLEEYATKSKKRLPVKVKPAGKSSGWGQYIG